VGGLIEILLFRGTKQRTQDPNENASAHMPQINQLSHQNTISTGPPACIEWCDLVKIYCKVGFYTLNKTIPSNSSLVYTHTGPAACTGIWPRMCALPFLWGSCVRCFVPLYIIRPQCLHCRDSSCIVVYTNQRKV